MHAAMEAYYKGNRSLKAGTQAFDREWRKKRKWLIERYGPFFSMGIDAEWDEHRAKAHTMIEHYYTFDRSHPFFLEIVSYAIEERAFVEIMGKDGEPLAGSPLLSGRIDMVVRRKDGIWIVDHKALASAPSDNALDVDDQLTGYCYLYWRLTGEVPKGAMYNVLIKSPPHEPKILKDGSLSKDKSQRTTYEMYHQAIIDLGLELSDYDDMLTYLQNKGWAQFFVRLESPRTLDQLAAFEDHLWREQRDMATCIADPDEAYPNQSQYVCPGCSMMPLCRTMEEDGDVEGVKERGYIVEPPRVKIPRGV